MTEPQTGLRYQCLEAGCGQMIDAGSGGGARRAGDGAHERRPRHVRARGRDHRQRGPRFRPRTALRRRTDEAHAMTYVIVEPCIGSKDNSCVDVCPVDCIHPTPDEHGYEAADHLHIDPEECIDCNACVQACPVDACLALYDVPATTGSRYIEINAAFFELPRLNRRMSHRRAASSRCGQWPTVGTSSCASPSLEPPVEVRVGDRADAAVLAAVDHRRRNPDRLEVEASHRGPRGSTSQTASATPGSRDETGRSAASSPPVEARRPALHQGRQPALVAATTGLGR